MTTQSALRSGNDGKLRLLASVVDIEHAAAGAAGLKHRVDIANGMTFETRSTKPVLVTTGA